MQLQPLFRLLSILPTYVGIQPRGYPPQQFCLVSSSSSVPEQYDNYFLSVLAPITSHDSVSSPPPSTYYVRVHMRDPSRLRSYEFSVTITTREFICSVLYEYSAHGHDRDGQ